MLNKKIAILSILLIIISFIVYYKSLNGPFLFDDKGKIVANPDIREFNFKKLIYKYGKTKIWERNDPSRPVTYATFMLNYKLGKYNTFTYHLFNFIIHIFNAILLFLLTKKIWGYVFKKVNIFFPFFTSLMFALHPVNTIVASYVFNRSGALATMFYLSSIILFIKTDTKTSKFYFLSLICYILAVFSKQDAVTLPAILFIFDYIFLSNYKIKELLKRKYYHLGYWFLLFLILMFRYFYFGGLGDIEAGTNGFNWTPYLYFMLQPYAILRYLKILIYPNILCIDHIIDPVFTILNFKVIFPSIALLILLIVTCRVYIKKTSISKLIVFGVLWFFITILPTSSIFPTTAVIAENRLYVPGIGFYVLISTVLYFIYDTMKNNIVKKIILILLTVYVLILGVLTLEQNRLYANPVLLWEQVIKQYPSHPRARKNASTIYNNQGIILQREKKISQAIDSYKKAISIKPRDSKIYYNLALVYYNTNEFDKAYDNFLRCIELNPNYAEAHNNIAIIYFKKKEFKKAYDHYEKAVDINPNYAEAHNNLAYLLFIFKRYKEALREFEIGLKLNPNNESVKKQIKIIKKIINKKG